METNRTMLEMPTTLVRDPVCGMNVDPESAPASTEHNGESFYFCCNHCLNKFEANPEQYLSPKSQIPVQIRNSKSEIRNSTYTCPMHPEVVSDRPGSCPICGMALEPREISLVEE